MKKTESNVKKSTSVCLVCQLEDYVVYINLYMHIRHGDIADILDMTLAFDHYLRCKLSNSATSDMYFKKGFCKLNNLLANNYI